MIKFFRRYEKVVFWTVVLFILPTFSISFIMLQVLTRPDVPTAGYIYGEEIDQNTFDKVKARLAAFAEYTEGRDAHIEPKDVWNHMIFVEQAKRAGIEVTDEELDEAIQDFFKQQVALARASERLRAEKITDPRQRQSRFFSLYFEEIGKARFDEEAYLRLFENGRIKVADFEFTEREKLMIRKLDGIVRSSGKPTDDALWEQYQEQEHRRAARFVAFKASAFAVTPGAVTEDDLRSYYEADPSRFAEPRRVRIAYVAFEVASKLEDTEAPTENELRARYEATKERYRIALPKGVSETARANAPTATAGPEAPSATATPRYRPFEEVRAALLEEVRRQRARELARVSATALLNEVRAAERTGKEVDLQALAAQAGARFAATGLVEPAALTEIPEINHWALLRTVEGLAVGGLSNVYTNDDFAFFVRLEEDKPARTPAFEEVREQVARSYSEPPEDELRRYFEQHAATYREQARVRLEVLELPLVRMRNKLGDLPEGVSRNAELERLATEALEEAKAALKAAEGEKAPDVETLALDRGLEYRKITTRDTGEDLPAVLRVADLEAALAGGAPSQHFSEPVKTKDGKALFVYRVLERLPARTPKFEEVRDRVREAVLASRAFERARRAAEAFVAETRTASARFSERAAARGLEERETALLARTDTTNDERLGELREVGPRFVAQLFEQPDLGAVFGPIADEQGQVVFVFRYVRRAPAPAEGFAGKRLALYDRLQPQAGNDLLERWRLHARLEAREVSDDVLRELYALRLGADGLDAIEARRIYIAADKETIDRLMDERARKLAEQAREKILAAPHLERAFGKIARKYSEDESTRRKSGNLGWFSRGQMVKPFEDAAFGAAIGELVGPVKTRFGYHLILVTGKQGDRVRARHILFRTERAIDPKTGIEKPLPEEILEAAKKKALAKAKRVMARLEAGEPFRLVALEESDDKEAVKPQDYTYLTPFELAVVHAPDKQMTDVLDLGDRHALLLTEALGGALERLEEQPRLVWGIFGEREDLEQLRAELAERREEILKESRRDPRRAFYPFRDAFEEAAADHSQGASASVRGELGKFEPPVALLRLGPAVRKALYELEPGQRSGLIEGPEGYHIVEVIGRKRKSFEEARKELARSLLEALER